MRNLIRTIILESLLLEDEQHVKKLFTNWANKKSGNPKLALSLMDDFLKYQRKIKRDFASFKSAEEMEQAVNQARASEQEKEKSKDAVKIFESPDVLVIAANTHQASCRYAAGTQWCTGAADTDEYWKRHNRTGTEFIWILKNLEQGNPDYKFSLHIKWNNQYDWCNAVNRCSPRTPIVLSSQSEKDFPNYFNYEVVLKKCMDYHTKRLEERTDNAPEAEALLKKIIDFTEANFYIDLFEELDYFLGGGSMLANDLEDRGFDDNEINDFLEQFEDFVVKKQTVITQNVKNQTLDYVKNMDPVELQLDFQNNIFGDYNDGDEIDRLVENFYYDQIEIQVKEIVMEELGLAEDDFLHDVIMKNWERLKPM